MEKSESSEHALRGRKKKNVTQKKGEIFYVANLSKNIGLKDFDPDIQIDLDAAIRLSKKKELTWDDVPLIQLKN